MDVIDGPLEDSCMANVGIKSVLMRKDSCGSSQSGGSPLIFLPQALGIGTAGEGARNGEVSGWAEVYWRAESVGTLWMSSQRCVTGKSLLGTREKGEQTFILVLTTSFFLKAEF